MLAGGPESRLITAPQPSAAWRLLRTAAIFFRAARIRPFGCGRFLRLGPIVFGRRRQSFTERRPSFAAAKSPTGVDEHSASTAPCWPTQRFSEEDSGAIST